MSSHSEIAVHTPSSSSPGPFGAYYLRELINAGGMAEIWLATDSKGNVLAIRRLRNGSFFNFAARKRFVRGAGVLARVHNHEFVIGYIDHGKIGGEPYLAMEYLESSNLKLLLSRSDTILQEYVGNILIDMALGLEHVQESGFMHLDFKPENILVSRNANVRIVDFDLALPRPEKPKRLAENPGTPAYMAPEQLLRRPVDHRADIFAYGVTAYELLTFRKPFPGETPKEILKKQLNQGRDLIRPRELNADIPAALERLILKCLERNPDKRYPFMSVLVRDLQAALYV